LSDRPAVCDNGQRKSDVTSGILHRENLRHFIARRKSLPKFDCASSDLAISRTEYNRKIQTSSEWRVSGNDGTVV
jgi:hypothetical protein